MKCKCSGELKRIGINCYQCKVCGLKQAMGILSFPDMNTNIKVTVNNNIIKKVQGEIFNTINVKEGLINEKI